MKIKPKYVDGEVIVNWAFSLHIKFFYNFFILAIAMPKIKALSLIPQGLSERKENFKKILWYYYINIPG